MPSLTFQAVSWPALGIALLVFGFAPGAVLRLIVLGFPRDDPRRRELLGELSAVPRIERPFWVIEQLEVALFEGLRGRFARRMDTYDEQLLAEERAQAVANALSGLPLRWRRLVELLMADPPASHAEISEQLGLPADSISHTWGNLEISCREQGCRPVWYDPPHDPGTACSA